MSRRRALPVEFELSILAWVTFTRVMSVKVSHALTAEDREGMESEVDAGPTRTDTPEAWEDTDEIDIRSRIAVARLHRALRSGRVRGDVATRTLAL